MGLEGNLAPIQGAMIGRFQVQCLTVSGGVFVLQLSVIIFELILGKNTHVLL